jgi:hypothetical protein
MTDPAQLTALARAVASELARELTQPAYLDAKAAAALLGCQPRQYTERISKAPGFPAPCHLPNNPRDKRKTTPRWSRADLLDYAQAHTDGPMKLKK